MDRGDALSTLEMIASDQWGIVTTAQAAREGITRLQLSRLTQRGDLQRARQGVYLLPSHQGGPQDGIRAAWLSLEPKSFIDERWDERAPLVVSHESAARIHGIGRLIPAQYTFSTPGTKQTRQEGVRICTGREISDARIVSIDGLPVTDVTRTVVDLAEAKIERGYLADIVSDALRKEGVRIDDLATQLNPFSRFYGATSGRNLVAELCAEASSVEDIIERRNRYVHSIDGLVDRLSDDDKQETIRDNLLILATLLESVTDPLEQIWKNRSKGRGNC